MKPADIVFLTLATLAVTAPTPESTPNPVLARVSGTGLKNPSGITNPGVKRDPSSGRVVNGPVPPPWKRDPAPEPHGSVGSLAEEV